jgi:hypothetical protein
LKRREWSCVAAPAPPIRACSHPLLSSLRTTWAANTHPPPPKLTGVVWAGAIDQVEGHIAFTDLGTPLSNTTFLGAAKGEVYGMAHTPQRFQLPWLRPTSPIEGLYLSGQDVVTDGVAGAAVAGVLCAIGMGLRSFFQGGWRTILKAIRLLI